MKLIPTLLMLLLSCTGEKSEPSHADHNPMVHDMDTRPIVMLNTHQQMVANVQTDTVTNGMIDEMVTMLGTTVVNENHTALITSRIKGRIEQLFTKTPGQLITNGAPLYRIYSEELLSDQKEFITATEALNKAVFQKEVAAKLVEASRKKLLLWGMKEAQIQDIAATGKADATLVFYSDYVGSLTQLLIYEGQYVDIGTPMFALADLSEVWIETQLYTDEVKFLNAAGKVEVDFPYIPNRIFSAAIAYENPTLNPDSKINLVRFKLSNPGQQIKPGEMAYVHFSKFSRQAIVVPRTAVVYEAMPAVWVKIDKDAFEKRMVTLGIQNKKQVEILTGLKPGEVVATTGSYLINSEYILQKGAGSMGGMIH